MKRSKIIYIFSLVILFTGFYALDSDIYFKINKSIELFGKVYKEITLNYVDEVDPEKFVIKGIEGMLGSLDPYTVYIDETEKKDLDIMTNGKYGGIGSTVGLRDGKVTIIDLLEGYSAQRQGIRIGDVIVAVDSIKIGKENYDELGKYLKKEPGTLITVKIEREGESELLTFNLVAEEIEIKNISYYGFYPEGSSNAYIKLRGFSRTAGKEVRDALMTLGSKKNIESIVLDLRNNPGGLLDAAIDVCEKFLANKSLIVSVKGRDDSTPTVYYSAEEPVAKNKKLVVLINGNSASASEIVAGAIQDHDRGVIVGNKSFGKGLVQTIIPLSFNTSLKLTTARYFTPSGRCIQKIDYSKNSDVLQDEVDDLSGNFKTDHDRNVSAGGGITPDSIVSNESSSFFINRLLAEGHIFKFATKYYNSQNFANLDEVNTDLLFDEFVKYLDGNKINIKTKSESLLAQLEETYTEEYSSASKIEDFENLELKLNKLKNQELEANKDKIVNYLLEEIAARISGRAGRIKKSLENDLQFDIAYSILKNEKVYNRLLNLH